MQRRVGWALLALALAGFAHRAPATTIGGAMGNASADGRPFVWKNRDGGAPVGINRHYLRLVTDRSYRYLGIHPSDADPRMGVNEKGLAFGNCKAHAFTRSPHYDYANTQALKQYILGETANLAEARRALVANTLGDGRDWPRSVALMPGIFDATGRVALWEVGDGVLYEYDPESAARLEQLGWQIYARDNQVHERSDHRDDWEHEATRYTIPRDLLLEAAARGGVTVRDFIRASRAGEPGADGGSVPSRDATSATLIAHGVLAGEDPRIVTAWVALGQPDYAPFVPVWVSAGEALSVRVGTNDADDSLSGASEKLWLGRTGDGYDTLVNARLEPMEEGAIEVVEAARERWLRTGFVQGEAERIHRESAETAWHTLRALAAGEGRHLDATPELSALEAEVEGLTVRLRADARDPDGRIVAWDWDFGDGSGSRQSAPVHAYAAPGTYLVRARVTDDAGARNSRWRYVRLGAAGPLGPPLVSARVADGVARAESGDFAEVAIDASEPASRDLEVRFRLTGSAAEGRDYAPLGASIILPAGADGVTLRIAPKLDSSREGARLVSVTLAPGEGYVVGAPATASASIE